MSLLRDIQNDLTNPGLDVTNVLRRCKILATRLGSNEFGLWLNWELNGYPESRAIPDYRKLPCGYYANYISLAWRADHQPIPSNLVPEEYRYFEFRAGIAKAITFATKGAKVDHPELIPVIQKVSSGNMNCVGVWMEMASSEFEQLVSAVKTRVLDFVLEIEAENPNAGEAEINSNPVSPEKLQTLVNNFFGPVGNLAQHSHDFDQTAMIAIQPPHLAKLVSQLTTHIDELNLDQSAKAKAMVQLATLKAQESDPDPVIVKQAGRTLRSLTEGAIASLIATAAQPHVWQWVHQMLESFK